MNCIGRWYYGLKLYSYPHSPRSAPYRREGESLCQCRHGNPQDTGLCSVLGAKGLCRMKGLCKGQCQKVWGSARAALRIQSCSAMAGGQPL